eukprot:CAMPEP_0172706492 /NCGR_PEP_ID=MMETSP1074-20121228/46029_1 /TAXON_ID=2916 /ORGANISM="Ceratium fusus, Strain PA161109" /LENGTH=193 /DNA_ID=CAMNT_0013529079 /DNA_START=43 /DNA_END=625 /DNA_ORIENTATION=+
MEPTVRPLLSPPPSAGKVGGDTSCKGLEKVPNVLARLRRSLDKEQAILVAIALHLLCIHCLVLVITLVGRDGHAAARWTLVLKLMHPIHDRCLRVCVCAIVDYDSACCVPIVEVSHGPETLLATGVPDMQLKLAAIAEAHNLLEECCTNCDLVVRIEAALKKRNARDDFPTPESPSSTILASIVARTAEDCAS